MDSFTRMRSLHRRRHIFPNATINRDTIARENRFWCLFPGSNHLLRFFIRISYAVLSFGNCWQTIFQVSDTHTSMISMLPLPERFLWINCVVFALEKLSRASSPAIKHFFCIFSDFHRLDYCGIALLIMGSFVPWLYYGFYCHYEHKLVYLSVVLVLGVMSIIVSLYDKFSEPNFRPLRAGIT